MPDDRHVELTSPLGKDVLLFHRMTVHEELGRPFSVQLELLSKDHDLALDSVVGKPFSIRLETRTRKERRFHGIATEFGHAGNHLHYARYTATLRPWLWLLSRTANCRIFQEKTVPEIIKLLFRDHGFTDFREALSGSYAKRTYCVQYRETDFNFVSRLMEHEGIYYFFEHEAAKHTLVLADSYGAHAKAPGYPQIQYYPPEQQGRRKEEHFDDLSAVKQIQPGKFKIQSFDFVRPRTNLEASSVKPRSHDHSKFEIYDYLGDYSQSSEGDQQVRVRLQGYQARHETLRASGDACGVGAGHLFTLAEHPRKALNREYLIVASTHDVSVGGFESGAAAAASDRVQIQAMDSSEPFRSEELTPTPVVPGPQTAIVVGKSGEEIWTDEHGRVKVQFHWDREGKRDEKSSCWVRVAQAWAGKNWGAIALPRIGQEVVVEFVNGDADQPLITGRVYNGDNKVPYALPGQQTQTGIKSRSSKSGSAENFNELRFEDKKGEEQIYFHAEKDFERFVENDDKLTVDKGNRTVTIKTGNDSLTIEKGDRSVTIQMGGDSLAIKQGDRTTKLDLGKSTTEAMQSIELKVGQSSVKLDQTGVTIKGMMIKIEGMSMSELKAPMTTIQGSGMLTAKGGITMIN